MHTPPSRTKRSAAASAAFALLAGVVAVSATSAPIASAAPAVIASDLTAGPAVGLTSFTNPYAGAFPTGDGFETFQRGVSASIPFALLDDSLITFPGDTQGIVDDNDVDPFFGATDTENPANSGPVSATWVFDITGGTDLALSIDVAAMGDFEASSDTFVWTYSIDGGPATTAFEATVDEAASRDYTLASGTMVTLNDPINVGAAELSNVFQPVVAPLGGTGSSLTLTFTADTNGGDEAFAFRNIEIISDAASAGPAVGDLVITEIMQNPSAVGDSAGEWFEIANVSATDIDLDGWTIRDAGTNTHSITGALVVPAGGYAVLGNNADSGTNGGVTVDYEYSNFFLGNDDDEVIVADPDGVVYDEVFYDGGPSFPDPNGASMSLEPTLTDVTSNDLGANWCTANSELPAGDLGTPGAENDSCTVPPFGVCGDTATLISAVQGNGFSSPIAGQSINIEGVVVGDFQGGDELSGFFVQEEDGDIDGDLATSEGVFVLDDGFGVDVAVGDEVRVAGTVGESFGLTQMAAVSAVVVCDTGASVTPASITLPVASDATWEASEGMAVKFGQTLYASGNFTLARFGEVDLSVGGPLDNPTNVVAPGAPANALQQVNDRSRIQLDDGSQVQNPVPVPPYFAADGTLRVGDSVDDLDGVLSYSFSSYEVHPTEPITFERLNERPGAVPDVGGSMTVGAYNVLNYFTTLDGNGPICGPGSNQGCRGADTAAELERQQAKLVEAITTLDADVLGIIEIENAPDDTPLMTLVDALNAAVGAGTYAYIPTGPVGSDAIRVALIYQPGDVEPVGPFAVLDSGVDPEFNDDKNRAALAQTFREFGTDDLVTVAVNHLKSKGSDCNGLGDPDTGDGQGNCNVTRTTAAAALATWLSGDPTGSGSTDNIIVGDLNAYAQEDPITTLEEAGYTDLIESYVGTGYAEGAYSFNFFAQSGYLDHGLASPSLVERVTGANVWHVNADEPSGLDYNNFNQDELFEADRYRSSDHDPVIVGVCETTAPVVSVTADPSELWPANHEYVDVSTAVDVVDADENPTVTLLGVTSNEPDNGSGDGNTVNDIVIIDDTTFQLRAERSGNGSGRVYTITYEVTDDCGNTTVADATVTVPKSKGKSSTAKSNGRWK